MRSSSVLALAASITGATAAFQGFNYGATNSDGTFKYQATYEAEFKAAKNLVGTSGFTSARLYTMIQGGSSTNEPTQAIPAAISQGTSLLLGLWASGGQGPFDAEITALKSAIAQYGTAFTDLVAGISVGSEDLYRISPMGVAAKSGYGAEPATLAAYIKQLRSAIAGTGLANKPVGHVDTWTAWVNGTNQAVIDACDWVGMDAYPYFQSTMSNSISSGKALFEDALAATQTAVGGKDVWITETGWPVSGSSQNLGVPSLANAKTYWDEVGCPRFGKVNIWWYTLQDADSVTPNPSFGVVGNPLSTTPLYDLSCSNITSSSSSSASATSSSSRSSAASSLSTVATGSATVTGGSGLSPSKNAGVGGTNVTATAGSGPYTTPAASGGSGSGNYSTPTGIKTSATGTGSSSASSTPSTVSSSAAMISGSFVAIVGSLFAAVLAL
ncbi:glycoside hydrolase superfamily [Tricladium varicosporioides]|nr:glycoside hydrolase superfamily [Hymenoscyphus varicosporioides]